MDKSYLIRKNNIEFRLKKQGIDGMEIKYLPYLHFEPEAFANVYDAGCRMMILYAIAFAVHEKNSRGDVIKWLQNENLWEYVSPKEKHLFEGKVTDQRSLANFSWQIESANVLAWSLGLVSELSESCSPMSDNQYDEFCNNIPAIGDELGSFLSNLNYIDKTRIIDENLFNELVTTYLRDIYFSGQENRASVDATVSFERHRTLNWLRRFSGIEEWDETDTST